MDQQFYRTVIEVEVLSQGPIPEPYDLESLHYDITFGDCSGCITQINSETVDATKMAELLIAQGSSPEFFGIGTDETDEITPD